MRGTERHPIGMSQRLVDIYIEKYQAHRDTDCPCGDAECSERRWAREQLTAAEVPPALWQDV